MIDTIARQKLSQMQQRKFFENLIPKNNESNDGLKDSLDDVGINSNNNAVLSALTLASLQGIQESLDKIADLLSKPGLEKPEIDNSIKLDQNSTIDPKDGPSQ